VTREEALSIFTAKGVTAPGSLTKVDLKRAYRQLAWAEHPDRGGASGEMQRINAAYQILKRDAVNEDPRAGLIRKRMRELAGDAADEWRVRGFDGHYFRCDITVLGHPRIFREMAEAVRLWQTNGVPSLPCRAVFFQKLTDLKRLYAVYADGKFYADKPVLMEPLGLEEPTSDPVDDPLFVRWLPFMLDRLTTPAPKGAAVRGGRSPGWWRSRRDRVGE
jgi:DnaJ domain